MRKRNVCKRGHRLSGDNLIYKKDGAKRYRQCRTCRNDYQRRHMRKLRKGAK